MGRSIRVKYAVQLDVEVKEGFGGSYVTPAAWMVKEYGRPTIARLSDYVDKFVESLDGCNSQLKEKCGVVGVHAAYIRNQDTNEIVAEWRHPGASR